MYVIQCYEIKLTIIWNAYKGLNWLGFTLRQNLTYWDYSRIEDRRKEKGVEDEERQ